MLDENIIERASRLINVACQERDKQYPLEIRRIESEAVANGMFGSGRTQIYIHQVYEREVATRAIIIWESIVRMHRTLGSELTDTLRDDLKETFNKKLSEVTEQLSRSLESSFNKHKTRSSFTLDDSYNHAVQKHEIEIDIYMDSLEKMSKESNPDKSSGSQYNFYGNIGAIQTGDNASANVVQNLGADDKAALLDALSLVRESISTMHEFADTQKNELVEIVDESVSEINSDNPNNTKLRTLLSTVSTTIQSVASAPTAYQTIKTALLPLGIMLP